LAKPAASVEIGRAPDADRLRALLTRLIAFRTENPPGDEAAPAHFLAAVLQEFGCDTATPEVAPGRHNLVAIFKNGKGPSLGFNSHLDVVPAGTGWSSDPFSLHETEGRLIGRGACDAKGCVAAMVEATRLLIDAREAWRGCLTVVFVADEEVGSTGAKSFAASGHQLDRVVVGEPTRLITVSAHKGCLRPHLRVFGRSAHSGTPDLGENAILKARQLIELFVAEDLRLRTKVHPLVGPASLSVTRIQGGVADNVIPDFCDVVIDRRILPGEEVEAVDAEIRALLARAAGEHGIHSEILRYSSNAGPSETPGDDPIVQASLVACRAQGVAEPGPIGFLGGCDLVHFQRVGIRGVVLGPGSLEQAHQPDEYVALADLVRASLIYRDLALDWFSRQSN
jgi:acetylornithine deacetylase/succinyl-diaminopimelate desuccinylase family protein